MPTKRGSIRLFRLFGIDVYLHWAWFLVFVYFSSQPNEYSSYLWNAFEVLALFGIVLIHEFGHQLACRQVGGQTNDIVLWPLGGVAYVSPPQRPGAQLWSIAAGPLVNVMLIPILSALVSVSWHLNWEDAHHDAYLLVHHIWGINMILLCFNMLPVYPLDGGQIFRSLLWFVVGRVNSLLVASLFGFVSVAGMIAFAIWQRPGYRPAELDHHEVASLIASAIWQQPVWTGIMAVFVALNCWNGFKQARALARVAKLPRRAGFACPSCKTGPPVGAYWRCGKCGTTFDMFFTQAVCPNCQSQYNAIQCLDCGTASSLGAWMTAPPANN